jgi:predicted RNA-binding protein with PIN domain
MKLFIIDAFNLIHKDKESSQIFKNNMDTGISAIAAKISLYAQRYRAYKFKLVLDGNNYNPAKSSANISFIESGNINADNKIRELINKSKNKSQLTIISSDTEVYNFARINACNVMISEDFLAKIKLQTANSSVTKLSKKTKSEKPTRPSKKEYNELLEAFSK